ncbi:hypothetical protein BH18ACI4_BH18ACI4_22200 [soil metagenome]
MQGNYVYFVVAQSTLFNFLSQHLSPQVDGITPEPEFENQSRNNLEHKRLALVVDDVADVTYLLSHLTKPIEPRTLLDLIEHL